MQGLSPVPPRPQTQVHIDSSRPAYIVIEKRGFFDDADKLWEKGSMIYWDGEPNPGLDPINDMAMDRMRSYLQVLDDKAMEVAKLKGAGHASMVNAFEARRRLAELDSNGTDAVDGFSEPSILGMKKKRSHAAAPVDGVGQIQFNHGTQNSTPRRGPGRPAKTEASA